MAKAKKKKAAKPSGKAIPQTPPPTKGGDGDLQAKRMRVSQDNFLQQFKATGNISGAARLAQLDRSTHYDWLANDPTYPARFKVAEEEAIDVLETEARRRAVGGVDEPVFYKGKEITRVKKYSDVLLMFLLNGRRSEVFKHRHEHTGKDGGPIQTEDVLKNAKDSLLEKLQRLSKRTGTPLPAAVKKAAKAKRRS